MMVSILKKGYDNIVLNLNCIAAVVSVKYYYERFIEKSRMNYDAFDILLIATLPHELG